MPQKSPSPPATNKPEPERERAEGASPQPDLQPPDTGANRGSPAAPVMKQFQKTGHEGHGRK